MYQNLAVIAAFVFLYSVVAGKLERTPISGAIVFIVFGFAFGPLGLGLVNLDVSAETLKTLVEITLALVLFIDAANADLGELRRSFKLPQRMLLIAFPLTIVFGFGVGLLFFSDLALIEVAILATILAPTDAALGKAVITNTSVPANIRECLNVESGLNDGLCVPVLFVFLALAAGPHSEAAHSGLAIELAMPLCTSDITVSGTAKTSSISSSESIRTSPEPSPPPPGPRSPPGFTRSPGETRRGPITPSKGARTTVRSS